MQQGQVSFYVHPVILGDNSVSYMDYLQDRPIQYVEGCPTSSSRTLAIIDPDGTWYHVKTHYPYQISRYLRSLEEKTIIHAIKVSQELQLVSHPKFAHLSETIGCTFKDIGEVNWGFLVREFTPRPISNEKRTLVPCFSLYGGNMYHPDEVPLIVQLIEHSQQDPEEYLVNNLILPLIECFLAGFSQRGILMELHGQNTLLELDEHFNITRLVYRDCDLYVHADVREKLGLDLDDFSNSHLLRSSQSNQDKYQLSLIFDRTIGLHHLDYQVKTSQKYFSSVSPERIHQRTRELFSQLLPDYKTYFPDMIYILRDTADENGVFPFVSTNKEPYWRHP